MPFHEKNTSIVVIGKCKQNLTFIITCIFLVFFSSGGGSHNEEVALELLQKHGGNVQFALQDLLSTYDYEELDAMSLFSR